LATGFAMPASFLPRIDFDMLDSFL